MAGIILIGTQWGDEGKGKATDILGSKINYSVKFNGGNNAGHTVVIDKKKYSLHLLPTGVLSKNVIPVIGNGVVVDLSVLFDEINLLNSNNIDTSKLKISANAHIIPEYNKILDGAFEKSLGSKKIGTTGRGIGPTYADKMNRIGIRIQDLLDKPILLQKITSALEHKNLILEKAYNLKKVDPNYIFDELCTYIDKVKPMITDTAFLINNALNNEKKVLFEGCQATMLDIDHGTYPYVTSSNTISGGALTGVGIGPKRIDKVIGVAKAYTTRVGEGPFPTELLNNDGEYLREKGGEYGATTGRPRRCGWFDSAIVSYSKIINGITDIVLTKIDILSSLKEIPICTGYKINGKKTNTLPENQTDFHHAEPCYEILQGWEKDISNINSFSKLPDNTKKYIDRIESLIGAQVSIIGTGPERKSIIEKYKII